MTALNDFDVALLHFLAVAELVESDLWEQYSELATNNPGYRNALQRIDESLPDYISGVLEDERSHATFIDAFLVAAGKTPLNLDPFPTLPSVPVEAPQNLDGRACSPSTGPWEVYHAGVFQRALGGIRSFGGRGGPSFPDIRENPNRGDVMPEPCPFRDKSRPACSVIRPRNTNTAGAVAAA